MPIDLLKFCISIKCSDMFKSDMSCFGCKAFLMSKWIKQQEHAYLQAEREGLERF